MLFSELATKAYYDRIVEALEEFTFWKLYSVYFRMLSIEPSLKMYWTERNIRRNKTLFLERLKENISMNKDRINEIDELVKKIYYEPE